MGSGIVARREIESGYLLEKPCWALGNEDYWRSSHSGQPGRQLVYHHWKGGRNCRENGCASQFEALSEWDRSRRGAVFFVSGI